MNELVQKLGKGDDGARTAPDSAGAAALPGAPMAYLAALVGGMAGAFATFYLALFALLVNGNLPPPAFTNSLCIDEKLNFMREHPVTSPELLVIGSSVAWRHFDGAAVASAAQGVKPLNAGFCGIHINQSVYVANWLLDRNPTVRHVVMIASPQDFAECRKKPTAVFDLEDVNGYVYGGASRWPYYIRYFSPGSLFSNARRIKDRRAGVPGADPLVFDAFGGGPLDTTWSRPTLYYGAPEPTDPVCFQAMRTLADRLHREGRSFMVVSTPLHPEWKAKEDPGGKFLDAMNASILDALTTSKAQYWNADTDWKTQRASFTDAIHLRWSAAQAFSAALAQRLPLARLDSAAGRSTVTNNR